MNNFLKVTQFLNGLLLIRFSISKLFAWPISVKAFVEMAKPLGIDPTFFRIFTGIIISTVCISYFTGFYLLMLSKYNEKKNHFNFILFSNILGTGVMIGALASEFLLRTEPKWPLVIIAGFIVVTSILNFTYLNKNKAQ
ncbi:MAG: hypothetical protein ACJAS4_002671 [Bacteriovoracaceae bacterium]|jgi:hypothetical protein